MNALLNYILEANLCLFLFILFYYLILRNETQFLFKRLFLLSALVISLLFPLIHLQSEAGSNLIPSVSQAVPTNYLPEVIIHEEGNQKDNLVNNSTPIWPIIFYVYLAGVFLCGAVFMIQIYRLMHHVKKADMYRWKQYKVVESAADEATFSFLSFIFIGQANILKEEEKMKILQHESIHARQMHSLDMLLINLIAVVFWFNPILRTYKNQLVQLHEFEADAQTTKHSDIDSYCHLLAKVALQSTGFTLVHHFNKSLTLKRISMMQTTKKKIRYWKLVAITTTFPLIFLFIACQDQVMEEVNAVTQNATMALDYPTAVREALGKLKKENPNGKFNVIVLNEEGQQKIKELKQHYGSTPESVTVIDTDHGKKEDVRYAIIHFNQQTNEFIEAGKDEVFTVVEDPGKPVGDIKQYYNYLKENVQYPPAAMKAGIEGTVYVQFVVQEDGSLEDIKVIKGIGGGCDEEAVRVIREGPKWTPAKQRGVAVKQRMIMPIRFLSGSSTPSSTEKPNIQNSTLNMLVTAHKSTLEGKTVVSGTVRTEEGKPLAGANVVLVGHTIGAVSDDQGKFSLNLAISSGQLAISYVGYKTKTVDF